MGTGEGAEHQAEEADADLGFSGVAWWADGDLFAGLVRLPRDDRKLGLRDRRGAAAAALPHSPAVKAGSTPPLSRPCEPPRGPAGAAPQRPRRHSGWAPSTRRLCRISIPAPRQLLRSWSFSTPTRRPCRRAK